MYNLICKLKKGVVEFWQEFPFYLCVLIILKGI